MRITLRPPVIIDAVCVGVILEQQLTTVWSTRRMKPRPLSLSNLVLEVPVVDAISLRSLGSFEISCYHSSWSTRSFGMVPVRADSELLLTYEEVVVRDGKLLLLLMLLPFVVDEVISDTVVSYAMVFVRDTKLLLLLPPPPPPLALAE